MQDRDYIVSGGRGLRSHPPSSLYSPHPSCPVLSRYSVVVLRAQNRPSNSPSPGSPSYKGWGEDSRV